MAKVMLVEDDNNLRQIYEDRLAAEGYTIVAAKDGEEALAMAVKEKPDLIIADIMMPKVSGFDMLDILRSTPETKDAKIIMMTALSQAEDKTRAEKLGADKYLVKSQVTLEDVARVAAEMLAQEKHRSDTAVSGMTGDSELRPSTPPPISPSAQSPSSANIPVAAPPAPTSEPSITPTTSIPVVTPDEPTDDKQDDSQKDQKEAEEAPAAAGAPLINPQPTTDNTKNQTEDNTQGVSAVPATPEAQTAKNLSIPVKEEKEDMDEKIDGFIASNPTLSDSPNPSTEQKNDRPDQNSKLADAVDGLLKETESTSTETPQSKEPGQNTYVADTGDKQEGGESQSMVHTKRIEPLNDVATQPPNLNELLAREAASSTPPPPISSVITPGGGSITSPTGDGTVNEITPSTTMGDTTGPKNPDPNSITL